MTAQVEALCGDLTAIRAPRGASLNALSWQTEAPLRMLLNNLDAEVAEHPERLVVYGGTGRAARNHQALKDIVATLLRLRADETLLVQSGKPVACFRTTEAAPRVLIANSLLVPRWATWDEFRRLEAEGLTMFGQMTAGSWIYIGTQGILQGTYQTFAAAGEQHFGSPDLTGRTVLTAGLGGMGGAQPLAATMAGAAILCVEVDPSRIERRLETRYLDEAIVPGADDGTGVYALAKADLFNLLCIPPFRPASSSDPGRVLGSASKGRAAAFCEDHRAFFVVDPHPDWDEPSDITTNAGRFAFSVPSPYVAHAPRLGRPIRIEPVFIR